MVDGGRQITASEQAVVELGETEGTGYQRSTNIGEGSGAGSKATFEIG